MLSIKAVSIGKHPAPVVWAAMRDQTRDLLPLLDDIERITVTGRSEETDGSVRLETLWEARVQLPQALAPLAAPEIFAWIDRATWPSRETACLWEIEPRSMPRMMECRGRTLYEPAMGGRGTRITFDGRLEIRIGSLGGAFVPMEGAISGVVESFVQEIVSRNFRRLTAALSRHLGPPPHPGEPPFLTR